MSKRNLKNVGMSSVPAIVDIVSVTVLPPVAVTTIAPIATKRIEIAGGKS